MVPLDKVRGPLMLDIDSTFSTVIVKPLSIAFHAMGCIRRAFTYPGPLLNTQGRTSCSSLRLLFISLTPSSLRLLGLAEDPGLVQQSDSHSRGFLPDTRG